MKLRLGSQQLTLEPECYRRVLTAMKFIGPITFLLMAIAACISIWFVSVIKPTSVGAFFVFAVWLISPYVILTRILLFRRSANRLPWFIAAVIVSMGGILLLSDVIFWHKDAQGAIALLLVPIFQGAAFVVLLPIVKWVSRYVSI